MATTILMPALSPTMTEGKLAQWLKAEGETVSAGDVIAEIETDKATMEVEAVDEGVLGKIVVAAGTDGVAVNSVIAVLLEDGEDLSDVDIAGLAAAAAPSSPAPSSPAPAPAAPAPAAAPPVAAPPAPVAAAQAAPPAAAVAASGTRIFASPLARRIAADAGLDLGHVSGSGPRGRIVKRDVEAAIASGVSAAAPAAPAAPVAVGAMPGMPDYIAIPNSMMRKTIARRLSESKQQAPHFYLTVDCRLDELLELRKKLNNNATDFKLSVNDLIIRAAALALKQVPAANASWFEDEIRQWQAVDISVAVAIDGGLITPIIRGAEGKGLKQISAEMKDLAGRARDGKLLPEEYQGGTFSISNLGMFGIKEFAAVINPPQGAILAVGAGEQRPVVNDGELAVATVMSCTLSSDHRVVDGAVGAEFMQAFKLLIEDPLKMLL